MMETAWHFTPVIELNNSLSSRPEKLGGGQFSQLDLDSPSNLLPTSHEHPNPPGLGNFDKIWRYLSLPLSVTSSRIESSPEVALDAARIKELCDNSITTSKGVRWWDGTESVDVAEKEEIIDSESAKGVKQGLTKRERRRKRREEVERGSNTQGVQQKIPKQEPSIQQIRPRSTSEAVIQRILSDTLTRPGTPIKVSRPNGKPRATSDHEISLATPLRPLRGSLAALDIVDQTAYNTAAQKKEQLMKKLRSNFAGEQKFLDDISIVPPLDELGTSKSDCIHVFVDASNVGTMFGGFEVRLTKFSQILIGFQDSLKRCRGIPISRRIGLQPFSYHNLSLVLERGRPAAKRVLVGSDNFPAIQEAKFIGYETNILERVHKAKELTPRQKKFSNKYNGGSYNSGTGQSSGSETTAGFAPEKWVEQAVDEILHLKMLESVVDAKTPSTIVLATGDAAEAEYSEGFLKMVERALEKGWKVELVSFKHNISGAYKRKEFRGKWDSQFKIITLDEYVEQLVGS
jgi:hypothetical protein